MSATYELGPSQIFTIGKALAVALKAARAAKDADEIERIESVAEELYIVDLVNGLASGRLGVNP